MTKFFCKLQEYIADALAKGAVDLGSLNPRMTAWLGLCGTVANTIGIIWTLLYVLEWFRCNRILGKLPGPAGGDLLGQLTVLSRPDHHNILCQWAAELGGIYRMRLAHMNVSSYSGYLPGVRASSHIVSAVATKR